MFNKRRVLFNFDQARGAVRKQGSLILFEGFMDVMSAHQSGVDNGVASMGTSLTEEQIYAIQRITKQVYVCYDGDTPGQKATQRALKILQDNSSLTLGVIQMPEGMDPDEYRRQYGEAKLADALATAKETPVAFMMRYLKTQYDVQSDTGRLNYLDDVIALLATVRSPVEQDVYLTQLATTFQLDKASLRQQLSMVRPPAPTPQIAPPPTQSYGNYGDADMPPAPAVVQQHRQTTPLSRTERAERNLLFRMLHERDVWLRVTGVAGFSFVHDDYQLIYTMAQGYFETHQDYAPAQFIDYLQDDHLQNLLIELESMQLSDTAVDTEIDDYLQVIMNDAPLEDQLRNQQQALQEATRLGDRDQQRQLVIEIIKLQQQKQSKKQA